MNESAFDNDIIILVNDCKLKDENGNSIDIKVPRPEYTSEIFSWK